MSDLAAYAPPAGIVFGLLALWGSLALRRKRRLIDDLPTAKTQGVFIGLVELKGTAESEAPLTSFLSEQRCVQFHYRVEEHWSRTVTETYTDSQGKSQTRTRQENGWTTVDEGGEMADFYLRDDTGAVLIRPSGAKLETGIFFEETCRRDDPLYFGKGPSDGVPNSDHRRRFTEVGIALHAPLYVVGQARERSDVVAPEIAEDKSSPLFLISTRSEEKVRAGIGWGIWLLTILGAALFVGGFMIRNQGVGQRAFALDAAFYAMLLASYVALQLIGWVWMAFNSLVSLRNRVQQAWSLIDVQLKRRHDLIPRLTETVGALRTHEGQTQSVLATLRGQMAATPPGVNGPDFAGCAPALRGVIEAYPDLKADTGFLRLHRELVETEQRIALARTYFNDIATFFNTRLDIVPDRWIGALGQMRAQPLLAADGFERAPVAITFAE